MSRILRGFGSHSARAIHWLLRFLTPLRIRSYPLVAFAAVACLAVYDRLAAEGLKNGISGALGGDFLSFYTGGSWLRNGMPFELTDPEAQLAFQRRVLGSEPDGVAVWVSPPYFAWAFVPFAALPYPWAFVTFVAASTLGLWFAFNALGRELLLEHTGTRMLWVAVQYYPTAQFLLNGQTTACWLGLMIGVFVLLRRGHDGRAGLLLGCFACKPQLALGISVALLVSGRFRALGAALLSSLAFLTLGFLTLPDAMRAYLSGAGALVELVRSRGYVTAGLHGSFEFATLLLDGLSPRLATLFGCATALFLLGCVARLWLSTPWKPKTREWDLRMAATFALGLVVSPHLFIYDLTLLLLPLFIAVLYHPIKDGLPLGGGPLLGVTALVWALGLLGPALCFAQQAVTVRGFGFPMAVQPGVVAILAWAWVVLRTASPASAPRPIYPVPEA